MTVRILNVELSSAVERRVEILREADGNRRVLGSRVGFDVLELQLFQPLVDLVDSIRVEP